MKSLRQLRGPLCVLIVAFLFSRSSLFFVRGPSMAPTIENPSLVVVVPTILRQPRNGSVAVCRDPWQQNTVVVKRIKGVPGDCIPTFATLRPDTATDSHCKRIPEGYVFIVGDNEPFSADSRTRGLVKASAAIGTVLLAIPLRALVSA